MENTECDHASASVWTHSSVKSRVQSGVTVDEPLTHSGKKKKNHNLSAFEWCGYYAIWLIYHPSIHPSIHLQLFIQVTYLEVHMLIIN